MRLKQIWPSAVEVRTSRWCQARGSRGRTLVRRARPTVGRSVHWGGRVGSAGRRAVAALSATVERDSGSDGVGTRVPISAGLRSRRRQCVGPRMCACTPATRLLGGPRLSGNLSVSSGGAFSISSTPSAGRCPLAAARCLHPVVLAQQGHEDRRGRPAQSRQWSDLGDQQADKRWYAADFTDRAAKQLTRRVRRGGRRTVNLYPSAPNGPGEP